jgi:sugar-phosphatase
MVMAEVEFRVDAVIFDLDGVLVDSRSVVDRTWVEWAARHGLEVEMVLRTIPGKRTRDAVALLLPESDADLESARIVAREAGLADQVTAIPGAAALLAALPKDRWGIATSGTETIARGRLRHAGLPSPEVFVTADMVTHGKPHPEVYRRAASALGVEASRCVVFEDAPSGVAAALAAGCLVVGVLTWAERGLLGTEHAVKDLAGVRASVEGQQLVLRFWD